VRLLCKLCDCYIDLHVSLLSFKSLITFVTLCAIFVCFDWCSWLSCHSVQYKFIYRFLKCKISLPVWQPAVSVTAFEMLQIVVNPFTASCKNAMTLLVPCVPESCEKFPHSSQWNFWSTESIFNQLNSVFLKTLNALCVCLQYKHPRSMKRVIRSNKPVTLLLLFWSHKCDFGAEPRSRIIATSAVKGLSFYIVC
jgi:hypothetical protein